MHTFVALLTFTRLRRSSLDAPISGISSASRVKLNAPTSDQLVAFVERKLRQLGMRKIVPEHADLAEALSLVQAGRTDSKGAYRGSGCTPKCTSKGSALEPRW
jgi:hypothetical protein